MVEFALLFPILILFMLLIIDLGRVAYFYSVVFNSAREGARFAAANVDAPPNQIINAAKRLSSGVGISVTLPEQTEDKIKVRVDYIYKPATGVIWDLIGGSGTIKLSSTATMQLEQ